MIGREVERRLGFTRVHGAAFFCGYGPATGAMWEAFGRYMRFACVRADVAQSVTAAKATFACMERWLS